MNDALRKKECIKNSLNSIYSDPDTSDVNLWLTNSEIEFLITESMMGYSFEGLKLRTRSKVAKQEVCNSLGYVPPKSFQKTQPKFPNQNMDLYVQKSNNLQIWNEEIDPERRYLIIQLDDIDCVSAVKIISGIDLALLDKTGTLTQKYQAKLEIGLEETELISNYDTSKLRSAITFNSDPVLYKTSPISNPIEDEIYSIKDLYDKLSSLIGESFKDAGAIQERNRGAELHKLICAKLGYDNYADNGQFPDILNQLLEVKLQTSATIDLGLVCPDSENHLNIDEVGGSLVSHKDVRYALFYGIIEEGYVTLTNFYLSTGEAFFSRFSRFEGKVTNKKLQVPIPKGFFD